MEVVEPDTQASVAVECSGGCALCSNPTVCQACDDGYLLQEGKCLVCPVDCMDCEGGSCVECYPGAVKDESGNCISCSSHCQ